MVVERLLAGRPWYEGDRSHLHFRLVAAGLSLRQAVGLYWGVSLGAGLLALRSRRAASSSCSPPSFCSRSPPRFFARRRRPPSSYETLPPFRRPTAPWSALAASAMALPPSPLWITPIFVKASSWVRMNTVSRVEARIAGKPFVLEVAGTPGSVGSGFPADGGPLGDGNGLCSMSGGLCILDEGYARPPSISFGFVTGRSSILRRCLLFARARLCIARRSWRTVLWSFRRERWLS